MSAGEGPWPLSAETSLSFLEDSLPESAMQVKTGPPEI
jgi:hypothetical protein